MVGRRGVRDGGECVHGGHALRCRSRRRFLSQRSPRRDRLFCVFCAHNDLAPSSTGVVYSQCRLAGVAVGDPLYHSNGQSNRKSTISPDSTTTIIHQGLKIPGIKRGATSEGVRTGVRNGALVRNRQISRARP